MLDQAPPPLDAHALSVVKDKVVKAKARLVLDHPFFGMAVSKRDLIYDYNTKTASMDAIGQMRLCPHFLVPLTVKNTIFLLAHEALHYMLCHSTSCLLYTSPSPRDLSTSRMPSSA